MNAIYIRFDDAYRDHARACLNSLHRNFPGHPVILADYAGKDPAILDQLSGLGATVLAPATAPEFAGLLHRRRSRGAVVERFKLWRNDFDRYDTILHLDADMLVLAPLDDLFSRPVPYFVANHEAAEEVRIFGERRRMSEALLCQLEEDGLLDVFGADDMANAGLFTLPRAYRDREQLARLARLAQRYARHLAFADQSLLSLWLHSLGQRPCRMFRDNFQTPFFTDPTIDLGLEDIRVLHFSSHRKPGTRAFETWERVGPGRERLIELFTHYRDLSV